MDKLVIEGGVALKGEVRISGAKNAALPILCAAILSDEPLRISNVPHLRDVTTMLGLLAQMGIAVSVDDKLGIELNAQALDNPLLRASGMIRNVPHPAKLGLRVLANPIKVNGKRLDQAVCSALGADNGVYLAEPAPQRAASS